ncbi:MAG TPA: penicillin acylase family protein [Chryseosolibacter sp.]|nr:penicillin acylase family protein [Chryseosolibacter sp.]
MKKVCAALVLLCCLLPDFSNGMQPMILRSETLNDDQTKPRKNRDNKPESFKAQRKAFARQLSDSEVNPSVLQIDPSSINIVRDGYGVPHIFAQTDAEVAYGLAWAHAEDDFETIQKCFLASKAMLGQYTGRDGALVDYAVHLLRIRELVNEKYDTDISDDFKAVLQGYCDGFNAYAYAHPKDVLIKKSFPLVPEDLIAYSIIQLAIGCGADAALKSIYNGKTPLAEFDGEGSNAFAFNSKITEDGNVYLAINTHHPLEGQVAWYEAHLSSREGWNIIGTLFPGAPVIFTGVNQNIAWTHTVNHPDKLDVYQLEMHPENELQYRVDGKWYTLEESTVKLKVKVPGFNFHTRKKIHWSIYGPTMITARGVFSIRTAAIMDIRALEQWYRMNKSSNFSEFHSALKMESHPGYNIVYADRFDTIYYLSNGRIPVRNPDYDWKGTLPGNTSRTLWTDIHPLEDLPQVLNPPSGYVYNTNHSVFDATSEKHNIRQEDYDFTMGFESHQNNRSVRVKELLAGNEKISYEEFKAIKYDLKLPETLHFPVNIDTLFMIDESANPEVADVIRTLKAWDRKGNIESVGAAMFGIFFYYVADIYQKDESFKYVSEELCIKILHHIKDHLLRHFGTTNVTLGQYQRLARGDKSLPLPGLPDVLAAMYSVPTEDGRVNGVLGECYIGLIKFTKNGPEIETINAYGASNVKGNRHYDDQMDIFQQQRTKKMTLDRDKVYMNAESVYHPEMNSRTPVTARLNKNKK